MFCIKVEYVDCSDFADFCRRDAIALGVELAQSKVEIEEEKKKAVKQESRYKKCNRENGTKT
jgi:hypothetical protein